MNINEYGQIIRANIGKDVSSANSYKINLEPIIGEIVEKPATLGVVNIVEGDETWLANQYVEYVVEEGVLSYAGQWRKRGKAQSTSSNANGNYSYFTVLA